MIDAGHGEPDGGATGISGASEQALNLDIALLLQELLEQGGMQVVMTRTDASGIFDQSAHTIREKKRSDLSNRESIMNGDGVDLFVSIHMNTFEQSKYSGPQVFFSPNRTESETIASCVQQAMNAGLAPEAPRNVKKAGDSIYLLKKAKVPAILIECGFLSNAREEKLLQEPGYQKKVAQAVYDGITRYFAGL